MVAGRGVIGVEEVEVGTREVGGEGGGGMTKEEDRELKRKGED